MHSYTFLSAATAFNSREVNQDHSCPLNLSVPKMVESVLILQTDGVVGHALERRPTHPTSLVVTTITPIMPP